MRRFEKQVVIDRPVDIVFAYLAAFENEAKWMPGVLRTTRMSTGEDGVGTRFLEVSNFFPIWRPRAVYEITEFVPNQTIAFKSISGPIRFTGRCLVEPSESGTHFTYILDAHIRGLSFLEPIAARIFARRAEAGFATLKRLVESSVEQRPERTHG